MPDKSAEALEAEDIQRRREAFEKSKKPQKTQQPTGKKRKLRGY